MLPIPLAQMLVPKLPGRLRRFQPERFETVRVTKDGGLIAVALTIYPIRAGVIVLDQDPFLNGAYMGVGAAKIIDGSARNSSDLSRMTNIITRYHREPDCLR